MKITFGSTLEKRLIVMTTVGLAAVTIIGVPVYLMKSRSLLEQKRMSVHDRVVQVVVDWSSRSSKPDDNLELQVIWADSKKDYPFFPDAAQRLSGQLQSEFAESKKSVIQWQDIFDSSKNPGGSVKTVSILAEHVREHYEPQ